MPYLISAAAILRSEEPVHRFLGLPVVIAFGFALSVVALALLTGGPYYCET